MLQVEHGKNNCGVEKQKQKKTGTQLCWSEHLQESGSQESLTFWHPKFLVFRVFIFLIHTHQRVCDNILIITLHQVYSEWPG